MKRNSDRKHDAKEIFLSQGGYDDVNRARTYHPVDMPYENWLRTIEDFLDEKYIKRCEPNKKVREIQLFPFRGGQCHTVAPPIKIVQNIHHVHCVHLVEKRNSDR
ncbi:hypothetical protein Hdeb2414_s0071g00773411 [Helianthus debilis subsp. tardiflorus]